MRNVEARFSVLLGVKLCRLWGIMTHCQFKLCEGRHVNDTDRLLAAFDFCSNNVEPVRLVESLTLIQRQ